MILAAPGFLPKQWNLNAMDLLLMLRGEACVSKGWVNLWKAILLRICGKLSELLSESNFPSIGENNEASKNRDDSCFFSFADFPSLFASSFSSCSILISSSRFMMSKSVLLLGSKSFSSSASLSASSSSSSIFKNLSSKAVTLCCRPADYAKHV